MQILKEKIREQIVDSARECFTTFGYDKATLKNIADKADVSVGNIYRYFTSKEDILAEIMANFKRNVNAYARDIKVDVINAKGREYKVCIEAFTNLIVENYEDFRLTAQNRDNKYILDFKDFMIDSCITKIEQVDKENKIDDVIARAWTIAAFEGLAAILEVGKKADKKTIERINTYFGLILMDIKKRVENA